MPGLKEIIRSFKDKRIAVWGDMILDEYIFTSTSRISREAPVLITEFNSNNYKAGGAGNVVMNIKSLGANPVPVGLIGQDSDGDELKNLFASNGIITEYLIDESSCHTPKKSRILSGGINTKKQQILRIDRLNRQPINENLVRRIEDNLIQLLKKIDFLIVSDYLFQSVHPAILKKINENFPEKWVIMDSRHNLLDFPFVTVATPNEPELKNLFPSRSFLSKEDFLSAGNELLKILKAKGIILKRGHEGIMVFERDQAPREIGIHGTANIVDVTGAGDTVISVVALAMACGSDLYSAASLANIAAGLVVMKEGAYPVGMEELLSELP